MELYLSASVNQTQEFMASTKRQKICPEIPWPVVISKKVKPAERHIMKQTNRYMCSTLIVAAGLIAGWVLADEKSDSQKLDPKMEEMMKKAEAACMPGTVHKLLEPLVGEWNVEVKMWMVSDAPPTVSK